MLVAVPSPALPAGAMAAEVVPELLIVRGSPNGRSTSPDLGDQLCVNTFCACTLDPGSWRLHHNSYRVHLPTHTPHPRQATGTAQQQHTWKSLDTYGREGLDLHIQTEDTASILSSGLRGSGPITLFTMSGSQGLSLTGSGSPRFPFWLLWGVL